MNRKKEVSFDELYKSYLPLMKSTVRKAIEIYSISESEFEDLLQESAIALYSAAMSFDDTRGIEFGLYAKICIKNRIISYIYSRHKNRYINTEISLEDIENEESRDIQPDQMAIDKEALETLRKNIDGMLSRLERSVFWLYIGGMSYGDMANALSRPIKSIDNALRRIKIKLRGLHLQ